ncbi:hypothetical protein EV663_10620 [Rhodovulum bhavnagarense]|uniref:Uncharacterized protein n=1 Tax=Rhodovulum bhavnagarense TaxID=992286 RepID=A0A4R2RES5_9RHOB|nr:hypothetical protein EV663_10620 [Rhodovulum bhavnagarense]
MAQRFILFLGLVVLCCGMLAIARPDFPVVAAPPVLDRW